MTTLAKWRAWSGAAVGVMALLLGFGLNGCSHREPPAAPAEASPPSDPATTSNKVDPTPGTTAAATDPRLQQSFSEATVTDPPAGGERPPDTTMTGKSVGKLYTDVVQRWNDIRFVSPAGKRLAYKAILETEMGTIEISLRPDLAPNHVRSFVALARAGYYDGLVFDRTVHEEMLGRPGDKLELIEAGCPMGTGDIGYGSIGYWLKPEINPQATHEEGTVGASHGADEDTAACKFYIILNKAPFMDGEYTVFGKVTQGLDVGRKILSLPVRTDNPEADRPAKPVGIRKVTIETHEEGGADPNREPGP